MDAEFTDDAMSIELGSVDTDTDSHDSSYDEITIDYHEANLLLD